MLIVCEMYNFELRPETYPQIGMSDKDLLKSTRLFAVNALLTFLRKERRICTLFSHMYGFKADINYPPNVMEMDRLMTFSTKKRIAYMYILPTYLS